MKKAWEEVITFPLEGRSKKPRTTGLTMVIDKGMGLNTIRDLLETSGDYIDIIKLTFGTSAFYDKEYLREKNSLIASSGIDVMPGGTFLEIAYWQKKIDLYLEQAKELGFSAIEISDGTIQLDLEDRQNLIKKTLRKDFKVLTEVGKKDPREVIPISLIHQLIRSDLESGAFKVIIEAREAGKGVGIFDSQGKTKDEELENIISRVDDLDCLLWEAPLKNQQQMFLLRWGPNVNLGNIPPGDILALEALRQGVRGDTLKRAYLAQKDWCSS